MSKGFTLIELLVTIAIIGILSSALFLGRRVGEEKLALQRAAYKLAQDLREVQGMTMGAGEVSCAATTAYSFGAHFELGSPTSYYLFADCDGDQSYNSGSDELLREAVQLEKGIELTRLEVQGSSTSSLDIVFVPPDPINYINSEDWGAEGIITLCLESDSSQQRTVKMNTAGRIEVK